MDPLTPFLDAAAAAGFLVDAVQKEQFQRYLNLLLAWNERFNLTAVRTPTGIVERHFFDSLTLLPHLPAGPFRAIDVGSGAGFPGLPLQIMRPEMALVLLESVGKKSRFLQTICAELPLPQVKVVTMRAEETGQDRNHRAQYAVVMARAVAELRVLVEYLLPLCAEGGLVLAPKGERAAAELDAALPAIAQLGGEVVSLQLTVDMDGEPTGHLVKIRKTGETPERFPRRVGVPGKRPL